MTRAKRSGIRRRRIETVVLSTGETDLEAMMAVVAQTSLAGSLKRARAYVAERQRRALSALARAGVSPEGRSLAELISHGMRDYKPDTEVGFVIGILEGVRDANAALGIAERTGNAGAVHAFLAGASLAKAQSNWEIEFGLRGPITSGLKSAGTGRQGGLMKAAIHGPNKAREQRGWKAKAAEIWAMHPDRSALAVAGQIARDVDASKHTIRKHIKKPEQVGATCSNP